MIEFKTMFFIIFLISPVILADFNSTIATTDATSELIPPCDQICGCDNEYVYDSIQDKCVANVPNATEGNIQYQDHDILADSRLAKSLYKEGEKIFKGIIISALFFISCAGVCVFAACFYCCRIKYTDHKLHNDVKALAKKTKRDYKSNKRSAPRSTPPSEPMSESCNVVVAQAGVYVV